MASCTPRFDFDFESISHRNNSLSLNIIDNIVFMLLRVTVCSFNIIVTVFLYRENYIPSDNLENNKNDISSVKITRELCIYRKEYIRTHLN